MKPVILILTTHTGGGHLNLAQSLKEVLRTHCEARYDVVIADPQSAMVDGWYTFISRHSLKFLSWQYAITDNQMASLWLQRALTLFGRRRLLALIDHVQPRLIITTHAMISYATARAIERLRNPVPLVFQLTDLGRLHMTWFTEKRADAYLAPTREIFTQALAEGIDKNRLHLTGRPVRRQFSEASPDRKNEMLAALGFDPTVFTIFLQGGAKGSAGVDRTIEGMLDARVPVQIILATGNNKSVATRFANHRRLYTLSFTEKIAPYMAAADMIAGKAGASFISEAFTLEKPFFVTSFIPGQETANLQFIERHNLGWVCLEPTARQELLARIASNPAMVAEKVDSIRAYKAWNEQANGDICPIIDRLLS
ncbi:MAG TPA: glycosyltransferase [Ktedonobacteraceae bacterium]|nr:glycosyltransferase [Ktedonobacteraceae bacterium]